MRERLIVDTPEGDRHRFDSAEAFALWLKHTRHSAGTLRVINLATCTLRAVPVVREGGRVPSPAGTSLSPVPTGGDVA